MLSNLTTYLAIAEEALAETLRLDGLARIPKPDGQPGYVVAIDVNRQSFKQSLIAISFAGMYLDALLYIVGTVRLGVAEYLKIDRKTYEEKLSLLGVSDAKLLATCKRFRETRNDLTHEKAVDIDKAGDHEFRMAQREAAACVSFVKDVANALRNAP